MDTGYPDADSRDDFARARRRQQWSRLLARLRGRSGDLDVMLPFDEVVAALGRRGQQYRGLREIPLDSIVGSTDRTRGFDRYFRPTSALGRQRFERIAAAVRRSEDLPPIEVYRVGRRTSSGTVTTGSPSTARSGAPASGRWSPRCSPSSVPTGA